MNHKWLLLAMLGSLVSILIWSAIHPFDRMIWVLEVAPSVVLITVLVLTYNKFPLTTLTYLFVWFTAILMMIGGHYTYEEMPLFNWLRDRFDLARNHYDRLGHFFQGMLIALLFREILLRTSPLKRGAWLIALVCAICLAFSATYEIVEFVAAKITGMGAEKFLGLQGDVWDSQWDMVFALSGGITALLLFSHLQNRQLAHDFLHTKAARK